MTRFSLTLLALLIAFGGSAGAEKIGKVSQPLTGGTLVDVATQKARGLVTVGGGCSGTLINQYWVLTADHCVTTNAKVNGPSAGFGSVQISATWSAALVTPTRFVRNWGGSGRDVALIFLGNGDFGKMPIQLLNYSGLDTGMVVAKFGRGINAFATAGPPPAAALYDGSYRTANFTVNSIGANTYALPTNGNGQAGNGGDSGGSDWSVAPGGALLNITGVQSTCSATGYVAGMPQNWNWATGVSNCNTAFIWDLYYDIVEITRPQYAAFCKDYTAKAVVAANDNNTYSCGNSGARWTTDAAAHLNWCMDQGGNQGPPNTETSARNKALGACPGRVAMNKLKLPADISVLTTTDATAAKKDSRILDALKDTGTKVVDAPDATVGKIGKLGKIGDLAKIGDAAKVVDPGKVTDPGKAPPPTAYQLACAGGGDMMTTMTGAGVTIAFARAAAGSIASPPAPGECAWADRAISAAEPNKLFYTGTGGTALADAAGEGGAFVVHAYNDGKGVLVVASIDAAATGAPSAGESSASEGPGPVMEQAGPCGNGNAMATVIIPEPNLHKLNIRTKPGGKVLGTIPEGAQVSVVGECGAEPAAGFAKGEVPPGSAAGWCQIEAPLQGCVSAKYLAFGDASPAAGFAAPKAATAAAGFTGEWDAMAGDVAYEIQLSQKGAGSVLGSYSGADGSSGTIAGKLAGNVLRFLWAQADGTAGSGKFMLSDDQQSFVGSYSFGPNPDKVDGSWNGTRK